jgi:SAM-dependent methyltransferase
MNGFDAGIANIYSRTRYLPLEDSIQLVSGAVQERDLRKRRVVADVGCGIGRFLPALATIPNVTSIHAYDVSTDMLSKCGSRIDNLVTRIYLHQSDCALPHALPSNVFDIVLLHWVLNTTDRWHDLLENCVAAIRPGGLLLSFEEHSTLYDAIDGRGELMHAQNDFVSLFWNEFYLEFEPSGVSATLEKRLGVSMRSPQPFSALAEKGLTIERLVDNKRTWNSNVSLRWVLESVIIPKAFSNFWQIPDPVFQRALRRVMRLIARYPIAASCRFPLNYDSTPVVACKL